MGLRDLDAWAVPRAARRLQRLRAGLRAAVSRSPRALLQELDDRYASTGALRVVRDAPAVGALVAVSVLLAGAGTGVALARSGELAPQDLVAPPATELGVPVGVDTEAHLARARQRTVALARQTPNIRYLALVSVRDELTVARTESLVVHSGMAVRKAWVRAPVSGLGDLFVLETGEDPAGRLRALFAETARRKADEERELRALAASVDPDAAQQRGARASYEAAAQTAAQEAAAYRGDCGCVLAVVVEGSAGELAELMSLPAVRGVELAPRGTELSGLDVTPLPPDVHGRMPPSTVPGG